MTKLNVSQAARATGKNRTTLYRHMSSGKLSVEKDATDNPVIDVSELQRVYGKLKIDEAHATDAKATNDPTQQQSEAGQNNTELRLLKVQIEHLQQERDTEKERRQQAEERERNTRDEIKSVREEAQRLLGIIEMQTRQLAAPAKNELELPRQQRGFWRRLFK